MAAASRLTGDAGRAGHLARLIDYALYQPNPLQQVFYLLLVVGGYSAFLFCGLPHLPNDSIGAIHIYLSLVVVLGALHSFIAASLSSPGILLPQTLVYFDNYDFDGVLYLNRECPTCRITKFALLNASHVNSDSLAPSTAPFATIPIYPHYAIVMVLIGADCGWLNTCIGECNHWVFLRFLMMNVVLCSYGSYVLFGILSDEYKQLLSEQFLDQNTRTVVQGEPMVVVRYLIHEEAAVTVLFVVCVGMGFALFCFSTFHLYLVSSNLTTNEFFKRRKLRSQKSVSKDKTCCTIPHKFGLGSLLANWREVRNPRYKAKVFAVKMANSKRK